jgi:hypothetical protein
MEIVAYVVDDRVVSNFTGEGVDTVAMKPMNLTLILSMGVALAGCGSKTNPNVCCTDSANCAAEGLPDDAQCTDGLICRGNQCIAETCSAAADCEAGAPFCSDTGLCAMTCASDPQCPGFGGASNDVFCEAGACVECRDSADCGASHPVCDGGACRACVSDDECGSGVCGDDGTCTSGSAIVYLDPSGSDTGQCTSASPCKTLGFGLSIVSSSRQIISMRQGTYTEAPAQVDSGSTTASLIDIHGHGSRVNVSYGDNYNYQFGVGVSIRDLIIASSAGGSILNLSSQSATYRLTNVEVGGPANNVHGASGSVGTVISLRGQLVGRNLRVHDGVNGISDEGAVMIDGAVIYNTNHAMTIGILQQANIQATNVMMYDAQSTAVTVGSAIGTIAFSTIYNSVATSGTEASAADCNNSGVSISSSIIWAPGTHPIETNCSIANSLSGPPGPDPQFVNPAAKDFHLSLGSPAVDMASSGPAIDFEGDARPQGAKFDYGADEYKP